MLSKESLRVLKELNNQSPVAQDRLPAGCDWELLPHLVEGGWVRKLSLLPPGRESDYPNGLWAYTTSPAGKESLYKATSEKREKKNEHIFQLILSVLGFSLGLIVEHFAGVVEWLSGLFH